MELHHWLRGDFPARRCEWGGLCRLGGPQGLRLQPEARPGVGSFQAPRRYFAKRPADPWASRPRLPGSSVMTSGPLVLPAMIGLSGTVPFEISALRSRRRTVPYPIWSVFAICRRLAPSVLRRSTSSAFMIRRGRPSCLSVGPRVSHTRTQPLQRTQIISFANGIGPNLRYGESMTWRHRGLGRRLGFC